MSQTLKVDLEKLKAKNTPPLEIKVGEYTIKDTGSELVISNSQSNISINEIAAHYTPSVNDKKVFELGDVVKVDCGAELDGWVGDTAGTTEPLQAVPKVVLLFLSTQVAISD